MDVHTIFSDNPPLRRFELQLAGALEIRLKRWAKKNHPTFIRCRWFFYGPKKAMIELKNVEKIYHSAKGDLVALKNINIKVQAGEIFGVVGKSGAGKSTLIRCVNLLERPSQGQVWVAGQELTTLSNQQLKIARRQIGMIFQHFNLLSNRTVYENIALPLELAGKNKSEIKQTVTPLLKLTELLDKQNNYPAQLSGGQKQRVAIARALACQPKILLCDEATSALDPQTTKSILQLLKDINLKLGLTILLITHEIDVIKEICDRVALIDKSEIVEQDEIVKFFTHPSTQLAKEFIRSSLKQDLPAALQYQLKSEKSNPNSNVVLRIIFHGRAAAEPFIAYLMQELGIRLNILQANIEFLKNDSLGIMVVEVINDGDIQKGIQYLQTQNINTEIIGYVARDVN